MASSPAAQVGGEGRTTLPARGLVHARTLLGAIDDHGGYLVHNRPWITDRRVAALERMAEAWLADGGENWLPGLVAADGWLQGHLDDLGTAADAEAVAEFLDWADAEGLTRSD